MNVVRLGDITVQRLVEHEIPVYRPTDMFDEATPEAIAPYRQWLEPNALCPETGCLVMPVVSYLVHTRHHRILIDTCVGCDKTYADPPAWHLSRNREWLTNLRAAGAELDDIDFVFCTHLHSDHCGWNTRLVDGRWVPTFPNAKYIFSRREYEFWAAETEKAADPPGDVWRDSCLPIVEAGQALLVDDDYALDDEIWLTPTPGHSPGHVCVNVKSGDARAIFTGDLMHHPVQCLEPDWSTCFCYDPVAAAAARRVLLEQAVDDNLLVVPAHFPGSTAGRVVRDAAGFRFRFAR